MVKTFRTKEDFTDDEASIEIQRHIKGYLARKHIKARLSHKIAKVCKRNDPGNNKLYFETSFDVC